MTFTDVSGDSASENVKYRGTGVCYRTMKDPDHQTCPRYFLVASR
jgi:hypothetical protein